MVILLLDIFHSPGNGATSLVVRPGFHLDDGPEEVDQVGHGTGHRRVYRHHAFLAGHGGGVVRAGEASVRATDGVDARVVGGNAD